MTLALKGIEKRVGADTHIYPMTVEFAATGFNILLGTTLSGKTSTIQLIAGIERPTGGEIWLNGRDATRLSPRERNVSMVHQLFVNYPSMTVYENIASPLRVARVSNADIDRRVRETADLLRLGPMLKRRPGELSGGQQQRTALARALVKEADVILLDEPLANLDFKLREELRDELPRLFADRNTIVIYATSEPTEALLLGGHTATLHEGQLTQFGPTPDVYRSPRDLMSAKVFSDPPINTAPVTKRDGKVVLTEGEQTVEWPVPPALSDRPDGPYTVGIRPHHVTPHASTDVAVPIAGDVLVAELSGSETIVHFDVAGHAWVSLSHGIHPFDVGDRASLFVDVSRCFYFGPDGAMVG